MTKDQLIAILKRYGTLYHSTENEELYMLDLEADTNYPETVTVMFIILDQYFRFIGGSKRYMSTISESAELLSFINEWNANRFAITAYLDKNDDSETWSAKVRSAVLYYNGLEVSGFEHYINLAIGETWGFFVSLYHGQLKDVEKIFRIIK